MSDPADVVTSRGPCLELEERFSSVPNSRSPRILIPRMMIGLYDIRNNRGVGHAGGDVDPNLMDATVVVATSKWLVAELVRILHTLSTKEASEIVDGLVEREAPWVWSQDGKRRLLRTGLTWKQQTLVLLLSASASVSETNLVDWLEHPSASNLRKDVLRPLHKARLIIEYDEKRHEVRLLPPGVGAAEAVIASPST